MDISPKRGFSRPHQFSGKTPPAGFAVDEELDNLARYARVLGGVDYDSGWFAEALSTHVTTKAHNLRVPPSFVLLFFSPDNPPTTFIYPKFVGAYSQEATSIPYQNPVSVRWDETNIELHFFKDAVTKYPYLHQFYDAGVPGWLLFVDAAPGAGETLGKYFRLLAWK